MTPRQTAQRRILELIENEMLFHDAAAQQARSKARKSAGLREMAEEFAKQHNMLAKRWATLGVEPIKATIKPLPYRAAALGNFTTRAALREEIDRLAHVEGLSCRKIAEAVGAQPNTVWNILNRSYKIDREGK